jgi:DNA-binding MarR family transcriptional regulator
VENKIDSKQIEVVFNIQSASSWLNGLLTTELKKFNISVQQFQLMRILKERHENLVNIKLLTAFMPDRASNVSRLVDKLAEKKWVVRQEIEGDKRKVNIQLTDLGLNFIETTSVSVVQLIHQHLDKFSTEEIQVLNEMLEKMIA